MGCSSHAPAGLRREKHQAEWGKSACAAQGCPWQEWQKQSSPLHQMHLRWHQFQGLHRLGPESPVLNM